MRARNLDTVRIPMRWPAEVKPGEDDDLARSILVCHFAEIDSSPANIEQELLTTINSHKRDDRVTADAGVHVLSVVGFHLLQRHERVGFSLCKINLWHMYPLSVDCEQNTSEVVPEMILRGKHFKYTVRL